MDPSRILRNGPENANQLLVLAHGAGAAMDSDFMNVVAQGVAAEGIGVARFEFPYMHRRREDGKKRPPDRQKILEDTWRDVMETLGGGPRLFIGGKSMGGRMASMLADEAQVKGLICLGYPFHPPGKPERLRTAHLADLQTPTLILQGTRDTLGKKEEVVDYDLSKEIRVHWLEDGDHSLKPRVKSGRTLEQNLTETIQAMAAFIKEIQPEP